MHGPHSIQIAYNDPQLGGLSVAGTSSSDCSEIARAWAGLGAAPDSPWVARLLDEHAFVLDMRPVDSICVRALLGDEMLVRLSAARAAAVLGTIRFR